MVNGKGQDIGWFRGVYAFFQGVGVHCGGVEGC